LDDIARREPQGEHWEVHLTFRGTTQAGNLSHKWWRCRCLNGGMVHRAWGKHGAPVVWHRWTDWSPDTMYRHVRKKLRDGYEYVLDVVPDSDVLPDDAIPDDAWTPVCRYDRPDDDFLARFRAAEDGGDQP